MQKNLIGNETKRHRKPIGKLSVVRNFKKVIEARNIRHMKKELYEFLNLYCGFIAHYDINGFKAVYSPSREFADVFIRHFDCEHRYFYGTYPFHEEPYRETGYTKAEIKKEFIRIVEIHKNAIGRWAEKRQKDKRYAAYKALKKEFNEDLRGIPINCKACNNEYEIKVLKESESINDFWIICCLFCGQ